MKKFTVEAIYIKHEGDFVMLTVCGYGMHSLLLRVCGDVLSCGSYVRSASISEVALSVSVPSDDAYRAADALTRDFFGVGYHGQRLGSM